MIDITEIIVLLIISNQFYSVTIEWNSSRSLCFGLFHANIVTATLTL